MILIDWCGGVCRLNLILINPFDWIRVAISVTDTMQKNLSHPISYVTSNAHMLKTHYLTLHYYEITLQTGKRKIKVNPHTWGWLEFLAKFVRIFNSRERFGWHDGENFSNLNSHYWLFFVSVSFVSATTLASRQDLFTVQWVACRKSFEITL